MGAGGSETNFGFVRNILLPVTINVCPLPVICAVLFNMWGIFKLNIDWLSTRAFGVLNKTYHIIMYIQEDWVFQLFFTGGRCTVKFYIFWSNKVHFLSWTLDHNIFGYQLIPAKVSTLPRVSSANTYYKTKIFFQSTL